MNFHRKMIAYYNRTPFQTKLIAGVILAIGIVIVSTIVISAFYSRWTVHDAIKSRIQENSWINTTLDSYISELVTLSGIIHYNNTVVNAIAAGDEAASLDAVLNSTLFTKPYIDSVILFDSQGNSREKSRAGAMVKNYNPVNLDWYQQLVTDQKKYLVFKDQEYEKYVLEAARERTMFSLARQIYSLHESRAVGVLYITVDKQLVDELVHSGVAQDHTAFSIVDKRSGEIIYDSDAAQIGMQLDGKMLDVIREGNTNFDTMRYNGENMLFTHLTMDAVDWVIISRTNLNSLLGPVLQRMIPLNVTIFSIYIVIFCLVLMGMRYLSNRMYKTELESKEAQLHALQRQINPHFIYNTLESIRMMAYASKDREIERMTYMLGRLMHNSMSDHNKIITVREELENTNYYLYIQQVRFQNKIDIEFDIEQQLYDYRMPKLILQPLVENAIIHGLEKKKEGGKILVRGYTSGENLIFVVKDNGLGIEEERLMEINQVLQGENKNLNIGLSNVNERIKLYYGKQYGLQIYGEKGKGAVSKLMLPNWQWGAR